MCMCVCVCVRERERERRRERERDCLCLSNVCVCVCVCADTDAHLPLLCYRCEGTKAVADSAIQEHGQRKCGWQAESSGTVPQGVQCKT